MGSKLKCDAILNILILHLPQRKQHVRLSSSLYTQNLRHDYPLAVRASRAGSSAGRGGPRVRA